MKDDGLLLLLLFAYGPVKNGSCGDSGFFEKIHGFLTGEEALRQAKKAALIKEIPMHLINAWPRLQKLAKKIRKHPLSREVVWKYINREHNRIAKDGCEVRFGIVVKINAARKTITVVGKNKTVSFLPPFEEDLKRGDIIAFHHNWYVGPVFSA